MKQSDLVKGCSTCLGVIVAGYLSNMAVDRHFAAQKDGDPVASTSQPTPPPEATPTPSPTNGQPPLAGAAACVDQDGSWKNWPYPNVPALGPKCPPEQK